MQVPHDDTASLIAFYGDPRSPGWEAKNLVPVVCPWRITFENVVVSHIMFHRRAAPALRYAFDLIWKAYGENQALLNATGMQNYSGACAHRTIRGSDRPSVHDFAAAIDFDAEHEAMNYRHISHMPPNVIDAFKMSGAFWGGDFKVRQDPMHFQYAREGS